MSIVPLLLLCSLALVAGSIVTVATPDSFV